MNQTPISLTLICKIYGVFRSTISSKHSNAVSSQQNPKICRAGSSGGTSADQDTRFSNKQAKLMKSQKFAPELEHLVEMTKVKMDVMRPWIMRRVTELLGFEDEVLINFIYGLLEGKVVNGKEIQISLTGFMEKNTGKFMKELWTLLLSAQKNASGVPQQFLDAKEEETRKKKAEADRITSEIQRKKEKEVQEFEQEKMKMDGEVGILRANNAALDPNSKHQPRDSSALLADENETNEMNGTKGRRRVSRSPHSAEHYPSSTRGTPLRSTSKSFSNSRSHSDERHRSRSISGSPQARGRSISSERIHRLPPRRSVTPRRRHSPRRPLSPSRRRPSHFRQRSTSRSHRRSPSPIRRRFRSPMRHRSRSPIRRRSRSPVRRRSRTPMWRSSRSPIRHKSRSPLWRRPQSPMRPRSPSPGRRRSPSPMRRRYQRSPSPFQRRPTIRGRRRSPTPSRRMSPSPQDLSSRSPIRRMPPSPVGKRSPKRQRRSPVHSSIDRVRNLEKYSPVHDTPQRDNIERPVESHKRSDSLEHHRPVSLRSRRDPRDQNDLRRKVPALSPSLSKSPSVSESPPAMRKRSPSEDRRSSSPCGSPLKQPRERIIHVGSPSSPRKPREHKPRHDTPEITVEEEETNYLRDEEDQKLKSSGKRSTHLSTADECKDSVEKVHYRDEYSPDKLASPRSGETHSYPDNMDLRRKGQETERLLYPEVSEQQESPTYEGTLSSERQRGSYPGEGYKGDEKSHLHPNNVKGSTGHRKSKSVSKLSRKVEQNDRSGSVDSGSEESEKHGAEVNENRKHKRSERHEVASDDDYSYDSHIEGRKEFKKRRKEEKRLRKEERRWRREERRRRREERRAAKLKLKSVNTVTRPSDLEKNDDAYASGGELLARRESHTSDIEVTESVQKKLEIELRTKALESLRAKKGIGH